MKDATIADVLSGRARWCVVVGDCLDVLPTIPAGSVGAVVSSAPYNQLGSRLPEKPSGMHAETQWISNTRNVGYADDMPEADYQAWHNAAFSACADVCKVGASIFINHKCRWRETVLIHPIQWVNVRGARLRQEIIWRRAGSTTLNARMFAPNEERILWFVVGEAGWTWNQHAASWLSVWSIAQDNDPNGHPCPYPPELPSRCIQATTNEGDVVLDCFGGSGTTAVAAIKLGRRAILIEKDEGYAAIARRRIAEAADTLWTPPTPRVPDAELFPADRGA